jgi:LCP family protein required for cell wall assembly
VLSIPRDLWVALPGFSEPNKINTAYRFGELYHLPGGGPALAMRTVEKLLGIPINYYVQIDFKAFVRLIDEIKGIKVFIQEPMTLSLIGTDKNVRLEPGWVTLPGEIALAYARSRSTEEDDFDRAARQRQIIMAVRDRILSFDMLPTLILNAPVLYQTISDGLRTNLTLTQAIRLAWLASQIPEENITLTAIGKREVAIDKSPDGQDIYIPDPDRIQTLVEELFSPPGTEGDLTTEYLVQAEHSRIRIVNESGQPGLAAKTAEFLKKNRLNIVEVVESEEMRSYTRLVDHVDDPYTLRFLVDLLKIRPSEIWIKLAPFGNADMELILGEDWAQMDTLP